MTVKTATKSYNVLLLMAGCVLSDLAYLYIFRQYTMAGMNSSVLGVIAPITIIRAYQRNKDGLTNKNIWMPVILETLLITLVAMSAFMLVSIIFGRMGTR